MFFLKELPDRKTLETYQQRFPEMHLENVEAALTMLKQASVLMRELDNYFASHDLSQLRYLIMVVLDREQKKQGLMASEIAERLDVSRPVMTRTLQNLLAEKLLETDEHGEDKRAKLISLTARGRKKLHQVLPGYYRLIDQFMREQQAT
ncbi:MAG: MarR family transcriptional regulator [Burkholderiales bacterium]|nr:MarR family transcriptional regulator [Burkholderiales bacterium]